MWDDAFPSFLIGLREGLEAGLIVSILVATIVRADQKSRLPQVWTGVLAAIAVAMSFGAVLTFSAANMPATAQEAFGGALSVIAVGFVTAMVFWMRRSARNLSSEIREKVTAALSMGAGMLVVTSFLAVGREGLETALFLWTTARAAGESTGPLIGAAVGLVIAAGLCWGLYRRVLKINLTKFFTCTGIVLIVIASGVLGYGLRDLQEGGVLPGAHAFAVHFSDSVDASSWWGTLLQGVFNLTPQMTWLQVVAYVAYLAVVMTLFVRGVRTAKPKPAAAPAESGKTAGAAEAGKSAEAASRRRPAWVVPAAVVAVPVVVAGTVIALGGSKPAGAQTVSVSETDCGKGFTAPKPGRQTFQMHNTGNKTSEVYLIDPGTNAVFGEIEGLAPGTTRGLVATIGGGQYAWRCVPTGGKVTTSAAVRVSGSGNTRPVAPVSEDDLQQPLKAYKGYVDAGLATLIGQTGKLADDIHSGDLDAAKKDWLTAHLTYSSLGAAYGTFEDFDKKINGRADGLPDGVHDKGFTGFHRIEYGLWHGESADSLGAPADQLAADVKGLRKAFPSQDFDVSDLPLRTHEILENTLQFELTADTDEGSGTNLATAAANLSGTRELLTVLRPLIAKRDAALLTTVDGDITRVQKLLDAAHHGDAWTPVDQLDQTSRQTLNGATGQLLEDLAPIPDLLEIRKSA
ncbi:MULTISPECIES: iron uptake transporter permease EfeU [Streptomycetaceae]|uniref:Iron permease FTR1 n=1 Tax=Streptantibioticus cattleyicolor (strain ATCC 35852 / DSM 46488 / JCM 4925 / NBRC 14057 / NRRL 8057) TaxID=1003195 RepID=F8K2S8_STREN|nr:MULTISPECIES: iron uptake transporter permease EfeU [Streptomycetaceae]AEW95391.1 iron permease FTR1 [Streptantibioticus cattleyicolor NRRL 8057 = DSM 46488]MYS59962.1 iron permease [Streptomyces sp. SID5468]CCB75734.1 Iron permease FTR1 [Streptantibioticus cattleyicolor NRRL 8057 = DSM 46488]